MAEDLSVKWFGVRNLNVLLGFHWVWRATQSRLQKRQFGRSRGRV